MPEVLVRNLDEAVIEQLKARARSQGRSLQSELKLILEEASHTDKVRPSKAEYRLLADRIRATLSGRLHSDSAELLAEDRAR